MVSTPIVRRADGGLIRRAGGGLARACCGICSPCTVLCADGRLLNEPTVDAAGWPPPPHIASPSACDDIPDEDIRLPSLPKTSIDWYQICHWYENNTVGSPPAYGSYYDAYRVWVTNPGACRVRIEYTGIRYFGSGSYRVDYLWSFNPTGYNSWDLTSQEIIDLCNGDAVTRAATLYCRQNCYAGVSVIGTQTNTASGTITLRFT